jgi:hypothetical protein
LDDRVETATLHLDSPLLQPGQRRIHVQSLPISGDAVQLSANIADEFGERRQLTRRMSTERQRQRWRWATQ